MSRTNCNLLSFDVLDCDKTVEILTTSIRASECPVLIEAFRIIFNLKASNGFTPLATDHQFLKIKTCHDPPQESIKQMYSEIP